MGFSFHVLSQFEMSICKILGKWLCSRVSIMTQGICLYKVCIFAPLIFCSCLPCRMVQLPMVPGMWGPWWLISTALWCMEGSFYTLPTRKARVERYVHPPRKRERGSGFCFQSGGFDFIRKKKVMELMKTPVVAKTFVTWSLDLRQGPDCIN